MVWDLSPFKTGGRLAILLLFGFLFVLTGCSRVEPPSPHLLAEARGDQCVEETDYMRRAHMDLLMHERDEAKRYGRRNPDHSFVGCIDCHVSPMASKNDPAGHFCLACHSFNAVRMDCFQCHLDRPASALSEINPSPAGPDDLHSGVHPLLLSLANDPMHTVTDLPFSLKGESHGQSE